LPAPAPTGPCGAALGLPAPTSLIIQGVDQCANAAVVTAQCQAINPLSARKAPIEVKMYICSPSDLTTCNTAAYLGANLWNIYPGGSCDNSATNCAHPIANDSIVVTVTAQIQIVTPLVRPFFGCLNGTTRCDISISSRSVLRYEGIFL
jgi:hypothetical protein